MPKKLEGTEYITLITTPDVVQKIDALVAKKNARDVAEKVSRQSLIRHFIDRGLRDAARDR